MRDGEAADEGEVEAGGAGVDVVGEVVLKQGYKVSESQIKGN